MFTFEETEKRIKVHRKWRLCGLLHRTNGPAYTTHRARPPYRPKKGYYLFGTILRNWDWLKVIQDSGIDRESKEKKEVIKLAVFVWRTRGNKKYRGEFIWRERISKVLEEMNEHQLLTTLRATDKLL